MEWLFGRGTTSPEWAIPKQKPNRGGWGYGISRGIKEIACGISKG